MYARYLLVTAVVGGLALFTWQTLSNVVLPWHEATMTMMPEAQDRPFVEAVRAAAPRNGAYYSARGVFAAVDMNSDMSDQSQAMGDELGTQIILDVIVAFLAAVLVSRLRASSWWSVMQTATFFGLAGLAANLLKELSDWNWYGFPLPYALVNVVDHTIQWFLIGALAAWLGGRFGGVVPAGARSESAGFAPRSGA